MSLPDLDFVAINLAYLAVLAGAFSTELIRIRILLIAAAAAFIVFGVLQQVPSMVVWNLLIGSLNLKRLVDDIVNRTRVVLTAPEETHRRRLFPELAPREFKEFWDQGHDTLCVDEPVVTAGDYVTGFHLLLRGRVRIERDNELLQVVGPGTPIGATRPMPFSTTSADWTTDGAAWLRSWNLADLCDAKFQRPIQRLAERPFNSSALSVSSCDG